MEPITLALIAFAGTIVLATLVITARRIREWFRSRGEIKESNTSAIAFTLAERIEKRQYAEVSGVFRGNSASTRIIQGFYDADNDRVIEVRAIVSSERPEQEVIDAHKAGGGLVIYT